MEAGQGLLAGKPVSAVKLRIIDDEVQVAGDHVNSGYLDPTRDLETKVCEGDVIWHRTGDAARLDDAGRLWLLGRLKDRVAQGDGWLYPFAVETAARTWPGVTRTALVAMNDTPMLAIEGDATHLPEWTKRAAAFGVADVRDIDRIPLDRRHRSKVDVKALRLIAEARDPS